GSSYGNAGLIVPSHSLPLAAPGALASGLKWLLDPESPFYIKPRLDLDLLSWLIRFALHCTDRHVRRALPILRDLGLASRALHAEPAPTAPESDYGLRALGLLLGHASTS